MVKHALSERPQLARARPPAQRTILIIDADEDSRYIFSTALAHAGFETLSAADITDGLRIASEYLPDLIVWDCFSLVMETIDVLRTLREDPRTRAIPVIATTTYVSEEGRSLLLGRGIDTVYRKPLLPHVLVELVQRRVIPDAPTHIAP